jgi:putative DNA primase/helicase
MTEKVEWHTPKLVEVTDPDERARILSDIESSADWVVEVEGRDDEEFGSSNPLPDEDEPEVEEGEFGSNSDTSRNREEVNGESSLDDFEQDAIEQMLNSNPSQGQQQTSTATPSMATIRIVKGEIARIVDETETALVNAAVAAPILVRAGMLVQPIVEKLPAAHGHTTEATLLRPLSTANIVYLLNKHAAVFQRYNERNRQWVEIDPPPTIATQLLDKGKWKFPKVSGVITAPTLRPDGSILDRAGYDPATQLWHVPDSRLATMRLIEHPTREQSIDALGQLKDLVVNFPFVGDVDHSAAMAAILTTVLRGAFDMTPFFLFRAHDVGSGKSFLANLISTIARGRPCPVITFVSSQDEMEKRLGALVLAGAPMISLDNCSENIGGNLLCQITEQPLIKIRILGKSETPECEWRGILFCTGNNITLLGDLTRRGLVVNLNAKTERPELREFDFDPIKRVLDHRERYIAAAITIARGYITAGKPKVCGAIASYGQWSEIVRSPLIWLGREDPIKSLDKAREEDPVRRASNTLIELWRKHLMPDVGYGVAVDGDSPPSLAELVGTGSAASSTLWTTVFVCRRRSRPLPFCGKN